jgi:DNA-binding NarL/FixJ family response regulator
VIRVLLADDHAIVLEGLRALLDGEPDIKVAGWTTDGTEVVELVQRLKPDVVVLDLELTTIKGTTVLAALRDRPAPPKVLVLTAYNDGESLRSALDAGADGLALKTESPQQTLTAIRQVHAGQLVFPQAARRWIEGRPGGGGAAGDLTPREREVWTLVASGLTNPQIAERLGLSDNTVKFHVQHLFSKLGVKNRTEAALKYAHGR